MSRRHVGRKIVLLLKVVRAKMQTPDSVTSFGSTCPREEDSENTAVKRLTVDLVVAAASAASDHHSSVGDLCVWMDEWQ